MVYLNLWVFSTGITCNVGVFWQLEGLKSDLLLILEMEAVLGQNWAEDFRVRYKWVFLEKNNAKEVSLTWVLRMDIKGLVIASRARKKVPGACY